MLRDGLVGFNVCIKETDMYILAEKDLSAVAAKTVKKLRDEIEYYIAGHKEFLTSLTPVSAHEPSPEIVKKMVQASKLCDVGPMAAVAGAISEFTSIQLLKHSKEVIVENGGDIFACTKQDLIIGVYAKNKKFSNLKIKILKEQMPIGICTSSGMFGHSFSFGKADAAVVISKDTSLADSAATRLCNEIKSKEDIGKTIKIAQNTMGIEGVVLIKDDILGVWGNINLL